MVIISPEPGRTKGCKRVGSPGKIQLHNAFHPCLMQSFDQIPEFIFRFLCGTVGALWRKIKALYIAPVVYPILASLFCDHMALFPIGIRQFHKFIGRH